MTIQNIMNKAAIVAVSIGLTAASAYAGPPRDSGRLIITEAQELCGITIGGVANPNYVPAADLGNKTDPEIRAFACTLLYKSDGDLTDGVDKCSADAEGAAGNGFLTYSLRNCAKNEAAQERQAASVVLSMDDVIERHKYLQSVTAAMSACNYSSKAVDLVDAGKLDTKGADPDVIDDADAIADALGYGDCVFE